jgi:hypothetical protein
VIASEVSRASIIPLPFISVMAARSDDGRGLQSAAALKAEGSPWETVLRACRFRPKAQHPRLDGNEDLAGFATGPNWRHYSLLI